MGQADIFKILEKLAKNDWISSTMLSKQLSCNKCSMITSLTKLRRYGEVESRRIPNTGQNNQFEHRLTLRGRSP